MYLICMNHDFEDDFAVSRILHACVFSGSLNSLVTIPNKVNIFKCRTALAGRQPPRKKTTDLGVFVISNR